MAGHARYTALLDACVLYSAAMTDALMSLATAGLFAAKWSRAVGADPNLSHRADRILGSSQKTENKAR